ncbi:hypothetical protein EYR40_009443 [Pleurotus pulmonarius]|nr:hypothetical protein EYR40_009443 [Pleurotus pulmonarius]
MSFDVQQFHNILRVTRDKLRASPPLSKLSSTKRTLIAADLVLVAASIRLLIIHESSSDQTFFIHARLALGRLKRILGTVAAPNTPHPTHQSGFLEVTFVSPGPEPPAKCAMPSDLRRILEYVTSGLDARISGDWDDSQPVIQLPESHASTMIPLAAVLLEYPVAYAPPPASLTFLGGISLDVYEVTLTSSSSELRQHTLLKFSCPHGLEEGLSPEAMKEKLYSHFQSRLNTFLRGMSPEVSHTERTFDRVAL